MTTYYRRKFGEIKWEEINLSDVILEEEFDEIFQGLINDDEILYTEIYIYKSEHAKEPTLKYKNRDIGEEIILIGNDKEGFKETSLNEANRILKSYGEYLNIRLLNGEIIKGKGIEVKLEGTDKCPKCGKGFLEGGGALSRKDNMTELCSDCGREEAMEDFEKGNY